MQLLKKILNKLNGLYYPQEYLCVAKESFQQPLHIYMVNGRQIIKEITHEHLFTGYSPLIFTLHSIVIDLPSAIEIIFTTKSFLPNDSFEKKDAIAQLNLRLIHKQMASETVVFYYEGVKGEHHFLSSFHQSVIGLNNRLYNKKPGNVFLNRNLYKQVQIAYSVPRIISLITVSDGKLYNLFPTDLHGHINDQYYVSSLRYEGKARKQVETAGRIALSPVDCQFFKIAFSLGKNHMQDLKPKERFPFSEFVSAVFQLPLPKSVLSYRELEVVDSFVHGIHQLFLYKIISHKVLNNEPVTLAHIHNAYATWRRNKDLPGNYLVR